MTARERAELITKELEAEGDKLWHPRLFYDETADAIEQAINAAVEEDRRARPHAFVGRTDRHCELCDEPDRDEIHIASREMMRNRVNLSIGRERESCAAIADWIAAQDPVGSISESVGRKIGRKIRARSNPAE